MPETSDKLRVEDIKDCPLFAGLNEKELSLILNLVETKKMEDGSILVEEGAVGDEMYILLEGTLQITQKLTLLSAAETSINSRDKMLIKLDAASRPIVGEMSLFEEEYVRSASMTAIGDIKVGVLKKKDLLKLTKEHIHLGYQLFYNIGLVLSVRLKKANQDILKLTTAFSLALEKGW